MSERTKYILEINNLRFYRDTLEQIEELVLTYTVGFDYKIYKQTEILLSEGTTKNPPQTQKESIQC